MEAQEQRQEDRSSSSNSQISYQEYLDMEQQGQQRRIERTERAIWLSQYYDYQQILKQRRKGTYQQQIPQRIRNGLIYEKKLFEKKDSWINSFIDGALKQKHKTELFSDQNISVTFPKQLYMQQRLFITKMIQWLNQKDNGFIQSPTGTGKTLCSLVSSLAWVYHQKHIVNKHYKVIYLSRTHSQLQQVIKQLKSTCYRPRMTVLGSRDKLCVNKTLKREGYKGSELTNKCAELRKPYFQLLKIKYDENYGASQQRIKQLRRTSCPYYSQRYQVVANGLLRDNPIRDLQQIGKDKCCAYFQPLYMQDHCDLFLMPYNYLLNLQLIPRYASIIQDSIIIFDEAHNVGDMSSSGRKIEINYQTFQGFQRQIFDLLYKQHDSGALHRLRQRWAQPLQTLLKQIKQLNTHLKQRISQFTFYTANDPKNNPLETKYFKTDEWKYKQTYSISSKNVVKELVSLLHPLNWSEGRAINQSNIHYRQLIIDTVQNLRKILATKDKIIQSIKINKIRGLSYQNIESASKFLKRIMKLLNLHLDNDQDHKKDELSHSCLFISSNISQTIFSQQQSRVKSYNISLNCLVPWFAFQQIKQYKPYALYFVSGTMKPIQTWGQKLNLEGEILLNDHVIKSDQVKLNIIPYDLNGNSFDFKYKNVWEDTNKKDRIFENMFKMIVKIIDQIPGGVIVVFPNKKYIGQVKEQLNIKLDYIKTQIEQKRSQFFEQQSGLESIIAYKKHIQEGGLGILYCVCRGRASEGIDFPDNECRAVFMIGIPYPSQYDPLMVEKKIYHNQFSGQYWQDHIDNQTFKAINQGLGRVIRHKYDYGQIFLIDQRYQRLIRKLPNWAIKKPPCKWDKKIEDINEKINQIRNFYTYNDKDTSRRRRIY